MAGTSSSAAATAMTDEEYERAKALAYKPPKSTSEAVPMPSGPAVFDPSFYTHMQTYAPTDLGRQTTRQAKASLGVASSPLSLIHI